MGCRVANDKKNGVSENSDTPPYPQNRVLFLHRLLDRLGVTDIELT